MICIFAQHGPVEIGFTALCIIYGTEPFLVLHQRDTHSDYPTDFLAFSVIIYVVVRSNVYRVPIPGLFRTIVRDATYYFLVVFTSHLMVMFFLLFENVRIFS